MSTHRPIARATSSGSQIRVQIVCSRCGEDATLPLEPDPGPQPICEKCRKGRS